MSDIEQRTEEWFKLRCGKFTGTTFAAVLAKSKRDGKPLKARDDLIWSIVSERIQGYQVSGLTSYSLRWGQDVEPLARDEYQLITGSFVKNEAFIVHPDYDFVGVSPDGLVDDDGLIEIKCPKTPEIHLQRWMHGVPDEYIPQIQGGLWVTGRKWCDFISYDPDTSERFRLLVIRVERDDEYIAELEKEVLAAEQEARRLYDELIEQVKGAKK